MYQVRLARVKRRQCGGGDGRFVALLLLRHSAGIGQRSRPHRQTEHTCNGNILPHSVQGKTFGKSMDRACAFNRRYGMYGGVYINRPIKFYDSFAI